MTKMNIHTNSSNKVYKLLPRNFECMPYDDIKHCIYCERKDFETFDEVLQHIRDVHAKQDEDEGLRPIDGGTHYDDRN